MNTQKPITIPEARCISDELIHGIFDVFMKAQREHPNGLPLELIAMVFAVTINQIMKKHPQFYKILLVAIEEQNQKVVGGFHDDR